MSPIAFNVFRGSQTDLDLNGPSLSFLQNVSDVVVDSTGGGNATFVGIATATFPQSERANNAGTITYQWFEQKVGGDVRLQDGANITGSATTTLTLSNIFSSENNGRDFYQEVSYTPGGTTGNAINEPLKSAVGELIIIPTLSFVENPEPITVAEQEIARFIAVAETSDENFLPITYFWTKDGVQLTDSTTVVGSATTTLEITLDSVGLSTIQCNAEIQAQDRVVSVGSSVVDLTIRQPESKLKFEAYDANGNYKTITHDILTDGTFTLNSDTFGSDYSIIQFTAPELGFEQVRVDAFAAAGKDRSIHKGGQGGNSRFDLNLETDVEYTIIGISNNSSIFIYRQAQLIAVIGSGGDAGSIGDGGDGGGINIDGSRGSGRLPGAGGVSPNPGTLELNGVFGSLLGSKTDSITTYIGDSIASGNSGGRTISCTKGSYWTDLGVSPCSNNSTNKIKFITANGEEIVDSIKIFRGFKPGYTISDTRGLGVNDGGNGGGGATGGDGGFNGSGGGGGSGYSNGTFNLQESRRGGNNTTNSFMTFRIPV
jgi:hypothetical protein|tara:strand:- start:2109 stop:3734 length:1626 start_codon:yes stop_codon:yes gene_type:complete